MERRGAGLLLKMAVSVRDPGVTVTWAHRPSATWRGTLTAVYR